MVGEDVGACPAVIGSVDIPAVGPGRRSRTSNYQRERNVVSHQAGPGLFLSPRPGVPAADWIDRAPRQCPARAALVKGDSEDGGLAGRRSPGSALARRDHGIARRPVPRGVAAGENWPQRTARREAAPTMVREPKAYQSPLCALAETAETPYRGRLAQFAQFPQTDSG